jgi:group I intron endonuclease
MKLRLKDKTKHPMYGKTHDEFSLRKISNPGILNPMFNKTHKIESKKKMSLAKSKTSLGLYDIENNLIKKFINQVELGKYLNLHKTTIGRYLKTGKLLLNQFYICKIIK